MDILQHKNFWLATYQSETGSLPVIPQPLKDNVCYYYLDFLLDMENDQNLIFFFLFFFFVTVAKTSAISFLR